jgi:hypothetical protein
VNKWESIVLENTAEDYWDLVNAGKLIVYPGASKLVAGIIMRDIQLANPELNVNDCEAVIALANQHASIGGLLSFSTDFGPPDDLHLIQSYQIAMTTLWISQFTKAIPSRSRVASSKRQRDFQACLLAYFFNRILGILPAKLERQIEQQTIKRFGLYDWYFDVSSEHELLKCTLLFEVMHMCGLEYVQL